MLRYIELNNFQSHKKTRIDFHAGVNTLIGTSNHGKSSVIRALLLTLLNQPSGSAFISNWTRNDKDKIAEDMRIELGAGDDTVRRIKGTDNLYEIEDDLGFVQTFKAFGSGVPDEVTELLNIGETNLQRQDQNFYLFSESNSEVVRRINSYTNLDLIDETLTRADKSMRDNRSNEKTANARLEDVSSKLSEFTILDELEAMYTECVDLDTDISEKENRQRRVEETVESFRRVTDALSVYSDIEKIQSMIEAADEARQQMDHAVGKANTLYQLIQNAQSLSDSIPVIKKTLLKDMDDAQQLHATIIGTEARIQKVKSILESHRSVTSRIDALLCDVDLSEPFQTLSDIEADEEDIEIIGKLLRKLDTVEDELDQVTDRIDFNHKQFHDEMGDVCVLCDRPL